MRGFQGCRVCTTMIYKCSSIPAGSSSNHDDHQMAFCYIKSTYTNSIHSSPPQSNSAYPSSNVHFRFVSLKEMGCKNQETSYVQQDQTKRTGRPSERSEPQPISLQRYRKLKIEEPANNNSPIFARLLRHGTDSFGTEVGPYDL